MFPRITLVAKSNKIDLPPSLKGYVMAFILSTDEQSSSFYEGQGCTSSVFWISECGVSVVTAPALPSQSNASAGFLVAEEQSIILGQARKM